MVLLTDAFGSWRDTPPTDEDEGENKADDDEEEDDDMLERCLPLLAVLDELDLELVDDEEDDDEFWPFWWLLKEL